MVARALLAAPVHLDLRGALSASGKSQGGGVRARASWRCTPDVASCSWTARADWCRRPPSALRRLSAPAVGSQVRSADGSQTVVAQEREARDDADPELLETIQDQLTQQKERLDGLENRIDDIVRARKLSASQLSDLTELVGELKEGVCRPEYEDDEDEESESSWTSEQKVARYRILAQVKADEVLEDAIMLTRESLGDAIRAAVNNGKIPLPQAVEVMSAGLVAVGNDVGVLYLVADQFPDMPAPSEGQYVVQPDHVEAILSKAATLKTVMGGARVLPILLGQSVHPDARREADQKGVHIIERPQGSLADVCVTEI